MVPGLIFRGARFRDQFIPLVRRLEIRIDIYDDAAILEELDLAPQSDPIGIAGVPAMVTTRCGKGISMSARPSAL